MNCHWKCCKSVPDTAVFVQIPKDSDERLAKGGTIYLCPKHVQSLKFWLDIKEKGEEDGGYYSHIGQKGGRNGHTGGFAVMSPARLSAVGKKGGRKSKRGAAISTAVKRMVYEEYYDVKKTMAEIAKEYGISVSTVQKICNELRKEEDGTR